MTALVVLHHHLRLRHVVSVPPLAVTYGGSTAGLYSGELLSVRNLLYAMLLLLAFVFLTTTWLDIFRPVHVSPP